MYTSAGRSRLAEMPRRPEFGSQRAAAAAVSHEQGYVQYRRQKNATRTTHDFACKSGSSVEENAFALEFGQRSCKKARGKPIQALIDEEMSKEMETRHPSPSVIAKLMGLDTLPPPSQVAHKQQKNVDTCLQAASSTGFQGNSVPSKELSCRKSTNEDQEFKDIFEVMETAKVRKHKNQSTRKAMLSSKGTETDMDFIRQKFMDVKRLSIDEALQNSKEFDDALEILYSNKDLFLEVLQDPDSLFTKYVQDANHVSFSPHPTQITVLKSSEGDKYGNTELLKSKRKDGRHSCMQKEVPSSFRKPAADLINRSLNEYNSSVAHRPSQPLRMGETETHIHPTRIVVLKPNLQKTQKMVCPISSSHKNSHYGSRKHREFGVSAIQELHKEGRDRPKFYENVGHLRHKAKGSREIAREIARQMRHAVDSHSKRAITSELKAYVGNESPCILSDLAKLNNSESFCLLSDHFYEGSHDFSPSSLYSTESSVSREARQHLSERWRMTCKFQDVGPAARGMSTLGEMLASSDRETTDAIVVPLGAKKVSGGKFSGGGVLGVLDCHLHISSKDNWKDGSSTKLRRSKSLPAVSTAHESPKVSYRKQDGGGNCYLLKDVLDMDPDDFSVASFSKQPKSHVRSSVHYANKHHHSHSVGEENELPELEIQVHSEELRKSIRVKNLSEEKLLHCAHFDEPVADRKCFKDTPLVHVCEEGPLTPKEHVKQLVMPLTAENEEISGHNHNNIMNKEDSTHHLQVDVLLSQSETSEAVLVLSSKESEQPSPVSVLEPPSEEESPCSGCFERISADLQELRMQLKLLKLESSERYEEESGITISSSEDSAGDSQSGLPMKEIHQAFRDEDERDFSYLLDMLIDSGIHGANQDRLSDACYSLDYPVGPHVSDKLETKYCMTASWSRSERKLLFDLVNCTLAGIMALRIDLHPQVPSKKSMHTREHEGLVEMLWQIVVKQRSGLDCNLDENILDPRWLGVEDDANVIVKEMERMLDDDLLEEILAEFIIG